MRSLLLVPLLAALVYFFWPSKPPEKSLQEESVHLSSQAPVQPSASENHNVPPPAKSNVGTSSTNAPPIQNKDRKLLVDLITTARQLQRNPNLEEKVAELRENLNRLPNKNQVLWSYYQELRDHEATPIERVEILDLMNTGEPNPELAKAAYQEAMSFAPEKTILPEEANSEEELNKALSTDPSFLPVMISFEIYLKSCGSYKDCLPGALKVLANNPNHNMRSNLIGTLNTVFPKSADDFARRANSSN